jgi:hypothetical protein
MYLFNLAGVYRIIYSDLEISLAAHICFMDSTVVSLHFLMLDTSLLFLNYTLVGLFVFKKILAIDVT